MKSPDSNARSPHPLAELRRGEAAVVSGLSEVAGFEDGHGSGAVVLARLRDSVSSPARCEVIAKMWPADPMVVRRWFNLRIAPHRSRGCRVRVETNP